MGRNSIHQKAVAVLLALIMVLNIFQFTGITAFAQENDSGNKDSTALLAVAQDVGRTVLYLDSGSIEISSVGVKVGGSSVAVNSNGYIITQHDSGIASWNNISVTDGTQKISLLDVNIDVPDTSLKCAFSISAGAAASLTLEGTSTLKSGSDRAGLEVPNGAALAVTAESTGSLNVYGGKNSAGIGGSNSGAGGNITISGGTVTAAGDDYGAGIGGGFSGDGGNITISGGTVTATGGYGGAGIGGGRDKAGSNITISGGTITAAGGYYGAGIGGGISGDGGAIMISGGTVTANGGASGAGIGGGIFGNGGTIMISGGTVTTNGGASGAGVGGGGLSGDGGTITISGGAVTANGGASGAGVGGGGLSGDGGTITISGGTVSATGSESSAGIGGGQNGAGGNIIISGGSVKTVDEKGNFSVSGTITDGKSHIEHCVTLNTGFAASAAVQCSVNDGERFSCKTDSGGRLYLWMPEGQNNVKIYYDSFRYTLSVTNLTTNISAVLDSSSKKVALNIENGSITFSDGTITQGIRAYMTNDAVISGASDSNTVSVTEGTHSITLDNLNINVNVDYACAFSISSGSSVTLVLENQNTLKSGYKCAGLHVPDNASLIIAAQSTGSLNATGGCSGAGIGGNNEGRDRYSRDKKSCSGNITINGGIVTATGGSSSPACVYSGLIESSGAGIGGAGSSPGYDCIGGDGGNITISGGAVTAIGGDGLVEEWHGDGGGGGAGIGGGGGNGSMVSYYDCELLHNMSGQSGNITISGGKVRAIGGTIGAAGIGSGGVALDYGNAGDVSSIVITGTNTEVYAEGKGEFVSDIGSGYRCSGSTGNGGGSVRDIIIGESNNTKKPLPTVYFAGIGTFIFWYQFKNCVITGAATNLNGTYDANGNKISTGLSETKGTDSDHDKNKPQTALPATVTDTVTSSAADLSGAVFPAGVTSVSFSTAQKSTSDPRAANISRLAVSGTKLGVIGTPVLYDLKLLDQNGSVIPSFSGKVKVKIPVPASLRGTPHIFRYEENTGSFTDMNATVENGFLLFETDHFSYYAVAGVGNSITLDTTSYTMPAKGSYQIGLKLTGTKAATVKFNSTSDNIATVKRLKNGNYKITGIKTGTAYIMFDVFDNKNKQLTHASVRVTVQNGVKSNGNSARQIGLF